jgi:hypothetical protein
MLKEKNLEAAKAILETLLGNSFLVEVGISVIECIVPCASLK